MSPLRRYLRITSSSVLEVRIYLDNPVDVSRWLLNERDPVLPRVMQAVRPLIMPKLREENERNGTGWGTGKGKGGGGRVGKRKGVRDLVVEDDFEVSIFLTESTTRHSILTKQKNFAGKGKKMRSNSGKMTGTWEEPVELEEKGGDVFVREESEETEQPGLEGIPLHGEEGTGVAEPTEKKRQGSEEGLFLSDKLDEEVGHTSTPKEKDVMISEQDSDKEDDKKKMALNTTYDGFSIYGRILCLVVKRRGIVKGKQLGGGAGQAMMEEWIASTQIGQSHMMEE